MKLLLLCFATMCACAWALGPPIEADRACHQDRLRFCPHMPPPYFAQRLFTSPCFLENEADLSPQCREMFDAWIAAHPQEPVPSEPLTPSDPPGHHPGRPHHPHRPHLSLEQACRIDRMRYCPSLPPPITPKKLFNSPCFLLHKGSLSVPCRKMMEDYLRHAIKPEHHYHHKSWVLRWVSVLGAHRMYLVAIFMGLTLSLALSSVLCLGLACCLKWASEGEEDEAMKKTKRKAKKDKKRARASTRYQAIPQTDEEEAATAPLVHQVRFTPAPMDFNSYMYGPYYSHPQYFVPPPNPMAAPQQQETDARPNATA